ncbi:MAG: hypothetical protein ACI9M3_000835 [Bacteroidia bacterium]|jgi:uncharacterized protein YcbK (DUF882 family)
MTKDFSISEFECSCGCEMPAHVRANIEKLAEELQVLREVVGSPITINSGYRCISYNKSVGGAISSQHLVGNAGDLVIKEHKPSDTHSLIESLIKDKVMAEGGLGSYNTFTHYDNRGHRARW